MLSRNHHVEEACRTVMVICQRRRGCDHCAALVWRRAAAGRVDAPTDDNLFAEPVLTEPLSLNGGDAPHAWACMSRGTRLRVQPPMLAKIGGCTCGREYRYTRLHVWPRILAKIRAGTE